MNAIFIVFCTSNHAHKVLCYRV
uniref:Uncharacterized protein n=1 Tax=Lepeophtheirus salmonis TaxID=72036 RepID=A0A0K2TZR9_LEPSM